MSFKNYKNYKIIDRLIFTENISKDKHDNAFLFNLKKSD